MMVSQLWIYREFLHWFRSFLTVAPFYFIDFQLCCHDLLNVPYLKDKNGGGFKTCRFPHDIVCGCPYAMVHCKIRDTSPYDLYTMSIVVRVYENADFPISC